MNENFEEAEQPEAETIEVSQWDGWKMAKEPNIIETTALGPCVGLIIYDPKSKQAMVGHFPDPEYNNLKGMLDDAVQRFNNSINLKIYIGGGSPQPHNAPHFADEKETRDFVKKQLKEHGFQESQITTRYQNSYDSTIMRIDPSTGIIEYDTESEWKELD